MPAPGSLPPPTPTTTRASRPLSAGTKASFPGSAEKPVAVSQLRSRSDVSASQAGSRSLIRAATGIAPAVSSISEKAISIPLEPGCCAAECRRRAGLQRGTVRQVPRRLALVLRLRDGSIVGTFNLSSLRQAPYGRFYDLSRKQELFFLVASALAGAE